MQHRAIIIIRSLHSLDKFKASNSLYSSGSKAPFLTQLPLLLNTVCLPLSNAERVPFLNSVCCNIDNKLEFNHCSDKEYITPPQPPSIIIPDYVSSTIKKNCSQHGTVKVCVPIKSKPSFILSIARLT